MSKQVKAKKKRLTFGQFLANNSVPIMFILFCAVCIPISGFSPSYLLNEIVTRMGRNTFLILCLLIPIMAGMGLNFGMTLGAKVPTQRPAHLAHSFLMIVPTEEEKPVFYPNP